MAEQSVLHGKNDSSPVETGYESLVRHEPDGSNVLSLQVDGVHCAACIQKIESRLGREENVQAARLNFSTRRLDIRWIGEDRRANDFAEAVSSLGYGVKPFDIEVMQEDSKAEERFLLICLGIAGFASGNIMTLSVALWSAPDQMMGMATRDFMHWVSALIAIPAVILSGRPFFRSALKALSSGHTNMDVPISIGLIIACGISLFETVNHGHDVYFDSAVMLIFFLLIGRYLDCRARRSARSTATGLLGMMAGFATALNPDGSTRRVLIRDLREDMSVRVSAGEKFPADGDITEGQTEVDTSLVTGETVPRPASAGSGVYAGTINLSAPVTMRVARAAEDSLLSDIVRLMDKAGQGQAKYVRLAEKAARLYTPVVHGMAAFTFLLWWMGLHAGWQDALMISVTVLIITCPCALGLAVPVVQVLATGKLMKRGILVKSGDAFERLATVDTVVFDKTGTLTAGHPALTNAGDIAVGDLALARTLAAQSHHPLARALQGEDGVAPVFALSDIKERPGQGMEGRLDVKTLVRLGSRAWCGDDRPAPAGHPMELWLSVEGKAPVPFYLRDQLRADAAEVVGKFRARGLRVMLLSGDRAPVTAEAAHGAGIDEFYGGKTPVEKYAILEDLKKGGAKILMVGDGLNDAPALAGATASMSPSTAIDMAQNAADIVFMGDRLMPVYVAYDTAVKTNELVRENFALAMLYNVLAIPLAVAGLVTPLISAFAMSSSSLVVIGNSFRLRWMK